MLKSVPKVLIKQRKQVIFFIKSYVIIS